jgi:WD40 repeat protein
MAKLIQKVSIVIILGFVAFSVISNHNKKFIATVEEMQDGKNILTVYTVVNAYGYYNNPLTLFNPIDLSELGVTKVYSIAFAQREQQSNYFALVGLVGDQLSIILWKWDSVLLKDPVVTEIDTPVNGFTKLQVNFSLFTNEMLCLVTDQFLIPYSIENKILTAMTPIYEPDYGQITSHCWSFEGYLIIATCKALLIYDPNFELVEVKDTTHPTNTKITCLLPFSGGFIAGGTFKRLEVYKKNNDKYELLTQRFIESDKLEKEKTFDFFALANTNTMNDVFIASTSTNDLLIITLTDIEKQLYLKYLISPFHYGPIVGLDTCINKPYLITCSKDKHLRIWDYKKRSLVIYKLFEDELHSCAMHPSGNYALVAMDDKILPLYVLYDEIMPMTSNGIVHARNSKNVISNLTGRLNSAREVSTSPSTTQKTKSKFGTS